MTDRPHSATRPDHTDVAHGHAAAIAALRAAGFTSEGLVRLSKTDAFTDLRRMLQTKDAPQLAIRHIIDLDDDPDDRSAQDGARHIRLGQLEFSSATVRLATAAEVAGATGVPITERMVADALLTTTLPLANRTCTSTSLSTRRSRHSRGVRTARWYSQAHSSNTATTSSRTRPTTVTTSSVDVREGTA